MKAPQYQIKNKKFITAEKTNSQGGKDFELKSGTKLSDVFNCLPYGRVNKTETGIGATTLELGSPRDSIVVQPLKVTAEGKSEQPVNGNNIHYYGKITPKSNGTIMTADKTSKLNSYISNSGNRFKKITVVVDNLESLINELGTSAYDYFLMLDEIDSIQKDSTFRSKMEDCIEIYKKFPEKQRSVISATLLDFSDPELSREAFTSIKYDVSPKEPILLNQSSNPIGYAATAILDTLKLIKTNGKDEKLVVAFNGVKRSVEIIDNIKKTDPTVIPDSDISILCGDQEKNNNLIARFNNSGIQNGILPSTLNFTTSAYFTGFDISEAYHLIILSDCRKPYTTISELEMIQIVGRCRLPSPSLLSFNIIHNWNNQPFKINHSKEELIDAAKQEIKSLECINHNYENNLVLREKMLEMRKDLIAITGFNNFNFVKETSGELKVSYLNIDAYIEHIRVKRELYNNLDDLYNCFVKLGFSKCLVSQRVNNNKLCNKLGV